MARGPANGVSSTGNALHLIDSSDSFVWPTVLAYFDMTINLFMMYSQRF